MNQQRHAPWMPQIRNPQYDPRNTQPSEEVASVLSAAVYPQEPALDRSMATTKQLFGGLMVDEEDVEDEPPARPRKRTKVSKAESTGSNDAFDDSRKQRGRPRVETHDQTAIDRRRTQIRLAQRAYRNRKETTITTLKRKVDEMQESLDRMNQVFNQLYDSLHETNVTNTNMAVSAQLEQLRAELVTATNTDMLEGVPDDDEVDVPQHKAKKAVPKTRQKKDIGRKVSQNETGAPTHDLSAEAFQNLNEAIPFSERVTSAEANPSQGLSTDKSHGSSSCLSYFDFQADPNAVTRNLDVSTFMVQGLEVERSFPVRASYTYSFQETSFSRRLHRLCLERAFKKLADPGTDPAWVARTFHFGARSRALLIEKFRGILQRKAGESLEDWDTPYFYVGGAGTHFPRRDNVGRPMFPPLLRDPMQAPGPWNQLQKQQGISDDATQQALDAFGFGGQWFDARDVEEYLKLKGVYLDGQSSFTEFDASAVSLIEGSADGSTTAFSATPTLGHSPASNRSYSADQIPGVAIQDLDLPFEDHSHESTAVSKGGFGDYGSMYNWDDMFGLGRPAPGPGVASSFGQTRRRRPGLVMLDVEKFLDRMMNGVACLGRAPGFRREAVDQALATAVQEAF